MRRALIVEDGREAFVLAAARGLARAGYAVDLAGPQRNVRAAASRAVDRWHPLPATPDPGFLDEVVRLVSAEKHDLVFGGDDAEVVALSAGRDRFPAVVPYGDHDTVVATIDKQRLAAAATAAGISVPPTRPATDDVVASQRFPVVVKAALHWQPGGLGEGRFPAVVAADEPAARERARAITAAGGTALLQDVVAGSLHALTVLVGRDGRTIALAQQRSLRLTTGGTSARAVTTGVDDVLVSKVEQMLHALRWRGLVNLQFLVDGGTWRLIDANARFYGSIALAMAAGVNFPGLWADEWCGTSPTGIVVARPGVRWQTFDGDLLRARAAPRRSRAVLGTLAFAATARHTTASLRDPQPVASWYAARLARRLRRR